jgi:gluconate 2-dehydrogenase gamma chain
MPWDYTPPKEPFFSLDQKKIVEALFDAILPGGSDNPGAKDAGAADYLDRLLAMDESTYYEINTWRPLYLSGLVMLAGAANARHEPPIDQMSRAQVTALLKDLSGGALSGFPSADWQKTFFGVLRSHCIEGCFADARWGGNRKNVIWDWYGYPTGPSRAFSRP